jgi:hypothetical protein
MTLVHTAVLAPNQGASKRTAASSTASVAAPARAASTSQPAVWPRGAGRWSAGSPSTWASPGLAYSGRSKVREATYTRALSDVPR